VKEMATSIKDFLGDVVSEIIGELFSVKMLKNILSKSIAEKTAGVTGTKTGETGAEGKTPPITFGGIFDYSDEEAYFGLIAKMNADPNLTGAALKISLFLNDKDRFSPGERRKFRAVVGNLGRIEYSKQVEKTRAETPQARGNPIVQEKTVDTKTNLGIEFLRSFAVYDETQMMEICKTAGIKDSVVDSISDGLSHAGKKMAEFAEKIETSPVSQKVITSLSDKMRARIEKLRNQANNEVIMR